MDKSNRMMMTVFLVVFAFMAYGMGKPRPTSSIAQAPAVTKKSKPAPVAVEKPAPVKTKKAVPVKINSSTPKVSQAEINEQERLGVFRMDHFSIHREAMMIDLGLYNIDWLREAWTVEYFDELKNRRERAKAWSLEHKPEFFMVGVRHGAPGTNPGPAEIARFNEVYQTILNEREGQPLFVYEEVCDDPVVTWEVMKRAAQQKVFRQSGDLMSLELLGEKIFKTSPQTKIVRNHQDEFVPICAEEWPFDLHGQLSKRLHQERAFRGPMQNDILRLRNEVIWLRSEIATIRTIEAMQRTGKTKAILYLGGNHAQDIEVFQPVYGYNLTLQYAKGDAPPPLSEFPE